MFRNSEAVVCAAIVLVFAFCAQGLFLQSFERSASQAKRWRRDDESSLLHAREHANLYEVRKIPWDDTLVISESVGKISGLKATTRKGNENERQTTLPEHWKAGNPEGGNAAVEHQREELIEFIKEAPIRLPDTSGITGQLTEELGVERFFSLWMVFNNVEATPPIHGEPFVIMAPIDKNALLGSTVPPLEQLLSRPHILRSLLLSHIVMGKSALSLIKQVTHPNGTINSSIPDDNRRLRGNFTTLSGRVLNLQYQNGNFWVNGLVKVHLPGIHVNKGGFILLLDKYLFLDDVNDQLRELSSMAAPLISLSDQFGDGEERIEKYEVAEELHGERKQYINPETFLHYLNNSLSKIPLAETFRHLLAKANISQYLCPGETYTVIVPPNEGFRSWDPIDYGFRPFSVAEFISVVIRNHFVRGSVNLTSLRDGDKLETLDGGYLIFRHLPGKSPSLNGVNLFPGSNSEITIPGGKILLLRGHKVLFVDEEVVRQLRRLYPEAESGPPILVDWTGSSFLAYVSIYLHEHSHVSEDKIIDGVLAELGGNNRGKDTLVINVNSTESLVNHDTTLNDTLENKTVTPALPAPSTCNPDVNDLICEAEPSLTTETVDPVTPEYCNTNDVPQNFTEVNPLNFTDTNWNGRPGRDWNSLFTKKENAPRKQIPTTGETREESFHHMLRIIHQAGGHIESRESEGYTIFVPTDYGLDGANFPEEGPLMDSWALSILYNHMVVGRIVDRDLQVGAKFTTLGNKTITVCRSEGSLWLNRAKIIESNLYVYDLGAMVITDGPVFPLPVLDENSKWAYEVCE